MSENEKISDEELFAQARTDLDAFGEIVKRYEQKLTFYILRISHFSDLEAQEILQETFIKAWKNINDFDPSLKFSSWIYRITHNEVISAFRKYKSRGLDQEAKIEPELFDNIPLDLDFVSDFDINLNAKKIKEILSHLSVEHREVLVLRFFEDKSYNEISDILKKPSGTVATLLNRAKTAFKKTMKRQKIDLD